MIGDVTVDIGTLKCLVNVGVNLDVVIRARGYHINI